MRMVDRVPERIRGQGKPLSLSPGGCGVSTLEYSRPIHGPRCEHCGRAAGFGQGSFFDVVYAVSEGRPGDETDGPPTEPAAGHARADDAVALRGQLDEPI